MTPPILDIAPTTDTEKVITADELLAMSSKGRYELTEGRLIEMSPPGSEHGLIVFSVSLVIGNYVKQKKLGKVFAAETGFRLSRKPDTVRAPDVAFVSSARLPKPLPKGYMDLAPDLVVEVVSPSDDADDMQLKIKEWLDAGARMVCYVYPSSRQVVIYRSLRDVRVLTDADTLLGDDILPDFSLPVNEIFE
jgi:Uma2 family endonuclease